MKITVLFQFVIYVEIYVTINCIILNSFPIMCLKGHCIEFGVV